MKRYFPLLRGISGFLLVLVLCHTLSAAAPGVFASETQDNSSSTSSRQELQDRLKELEQLQREARATIDTCEANIAAGQDVAAAAAKRKAALETERAVIEEQIDLKLQEINFKVAEIDTKTLEITQKQQEFDANDELFQQRLVAIYRQMDTGTLALLMGVNSYSELMTVMDSLQRISQHDSDLLELLITQRTALEAAKTELEGMLADLEAEHAALDAKWEEYNQNIAAEGAAISAAMAQVAQNEAEKEAALQAIEGYQSEMEDIWRNLGGSGGVYVGGALAWPVPSHNGKQYISSYYGWRTLYGRANFHTGIDIARGPQQSIQGADIVAANTGIVVKVVADSNWGYGNYVILDHGGGIKTLYAHCSAIYVAEGQEVLRYTPIAAVGNTGNSTGPHLHFELRINNTEKTDPFPYLNGDKELS